MTGSLGELRAANRDQLVRVLETNGPLSRADLMRHTGLSRSTVSNLVAQLIDDHLLQEREGRGTPLNGRGGRPPTLLELSGGTGIVVGVDLGHRHVRAALARPDSSIALERSFALDVDDSPDATIDRVAALIDELLAENGSAREHVRAVAMGVPGPVDRDGRMTSGILPYWRGARPVHALAERTGFTAVVDNDAHMGARGELAYGAARGRRDVIYVKASTGIGAGVIVDGRLVGGSTGEAGELGHVQVDEKGIMCRCGSRGCLETEVSIPKMLELLQAAHDQPLTLERVLVLAEEGDAGVNRALSDAGRRIGRVLADLCTMLNPERIVMGGDIGSASATIAGIRESLDRHAQPNSAAAADVVRGELGVRAELMGAIAVALAASSPTARR
ncbi:MULTISPECIES: ROK family transcriptional regulator [unclassified Nocardioides]|uniref:ROK family transcriptional regulator n=1 Tax=unclassified Nocardioides TaxID=2615069 RepID=UPI000A5D1070|nr:MULTISPECIES: ROK family transcriptional regulator [unclassified Nocardioides]